MRFSPKDMKQNELWPDFFSENWYFDSCIMIPLVPEQTRSYLILSMVRKTTFNGRWPMIEDDFLWKMTFNGMENNFWLLYSAIHSEVNFTININRAIAAMKSQIFILFKNRVGLLMTILVVCLVLYGLFWFVLSKLIFSVKHQGK